MNIEQVKQAILNQQPTITIIGKIVSLPLPQRSGTMYQQETYAYIKAQEILENNG